MRSAAVASRASPLALNMSDEAPLVVLATKRTLAVALSSAAPGSGKLNVWLRVVRKSSPSTCAPPTAAGRSSFS
jgi:hypothetical protein